MSILPNFRRTLQSRLQVANGTMIMFGRASDQQFPADGEVVFYLNERYAPEVFDIPTVEDIIDQIMKGTTSIWQTLRHNFPGIKFRNYSDFMKQPTFFRARGAPVDEDDIYGEPYSEKEHIYVMVAPNKREEKLQFYSSEELVGSFLNYRDFVNPKNIDSVFDKVQMLRLSHIADELLHETIEQLLVHQSDNMRWARRAYERCSDNLKNCLQLMLTVGMYMRGWKGDGPYPMTAMQTFCDVDRVQVSTQLLTLLNNLNDLWPTLKELPLMEYYRGNWRACTDEYNKLNKRVQIVIEGSHAESCIRMTSNCFTSTAWFYMNALYQTQPFDIDALRSIA